VKGMLLAGLEAHAVPAPNLVDEED
jgi:hypothetical protein